MHYGFLVEPMKYNGNICNTNGKIPQLTYGNNKSERDSIGINTNHGINMFSQTDPTRIVTKITNTPYPSQISTHTEPTHIVTNTTNTQNPCQISTQTESTSIVTKTTNTLYPSQISR